ncbi:hypothetical protein MHUMG1_10333 [Metarhizium humberi]|uniref:Bromo domain-containing protein n=1 Tax=Metarhizium humberi TaxID=2596975 RepID=A0A9P8M176_9HYPO|nr:hypothetical protein MHUMG1_10333 [Metarhizium humberi]
MSQQARILQLQLCLGEFLPDRPAVLEERNDEIEFRVVNNDGARESVVVLTGLKCLFQKQLPKMRKDYEGGTLMLCSMLPRIRYPEVGRMLLKQKEVVQAKIRAISKSHIVHQQSQQWANIVVSPIDPLAIPAIRETGWCLDMDDLSREPRHGPHFNELRRVLYQIRNHKQAWPFLHPVKDEAPDNYNVITTPMDLSTMEERLMHDSCHAPRDFFNDLKLVFMCG